MEVYIDKDLFKINMVETNAVANLLTFGCVPGFQLEFKLQF